MPYIDIWRVEDGKFVENWVQMDTLGLMRQIGTFTPLPLGVEFLRAQARREQEG